MLRLASRTCSWITGGLIHPCLLLSSASQTLNLSDPDSIVSYLVESCGLSHAAALSTAKKIHFKTAERADSFIALLSQLGFTRSQIATVVSKFPRLLSSKPDEITRKLNYFIGAGIPTPDLIKIVTGTPYFLKSSLERKIIPNFTQLTDLLGGSKQAAAAFSRSSVLLSLNLENQVLPNMRTLLELGVSAQRVVMMAKLYPRCLQLNPAKFREITHSVKQMGFDLSKVNFPLGIRALCSVNRSSWERRMRTYCSLGWSEEETIAAFKKHPACMLLSIDKIKTMFGFFVEKLGLEPSYLSAQPMLLSFSFKKRVLPRFMVMNVLQSKNLLEQKVNSATFILICENVFVSRYVAFYAEKVPGLLEAYISKLDNAAKFEAFARTLELEEAF